MNLTRQLWCFNWAILNSNPVIKGPCKEELSYEIFSVCDLFRSELNYPLCSHQIWQNFVWQSFSILRRQRPSPLASPFRRHCCSGEICILKSIYFFIWSDTWPDFNLIPPYRKFFSVITAIPQNIYPRYCKPRSNPLSVQCLSIWNGIQPILYQQSLTCLEELSIGHKIGIVQLEQHWHEEISQSLDYEYDHDFLNWSAQIQIIQRSNFLRAQVRFLVLLFAKPIKTSSCCAIPARSSATTNCTSLGWTSTQHKIFFSGQTLKIMYHSKSFIGQW